jgi:hypothetical protein
MLLFVVLLGSFFNDQDTASLKRIYIQTVSLILHLAFILSLRFLSKYVSMFQYHAPLVLSTYIPHAFNGKVQDHNMLVIYG